MSFGYSQVTNEHLYNGASSLSMAGSDVAFKNATWSIFINPAGLAEENVLSVVHSTESIFGLSIFKHSQTGVGFSLPTIGKVGLSLDHFSANYQGRSISEETSMGFHHGLALQKDNNSTLLFGYSIRLQRLALGLSAGNTGDGSDGIDLGTHSSLGMDIGFLATLRDRFRFGSMVYNINQPQIGASSSTVDLPRRLRLGIAYSPYDLVWTTMGLSRSVGHLSQISSGIRYEILDGVYLRSGIQTNPNRFGSGMSYNWRKFTFTYGFLTHPILGLTQQFSFEFTRL